jgi:hypothetical protein
MPAAEPTMPAVSSVTAKVVTCKTVTAKTSMPHKTVVPAIMVEAMVEVMVEAMEAVTVQEDDPVVGKAATAVPVGPRPVIRSLVGVLMVGASRQGKNRAGQERYNPPHHSAGTHRGLRSVADGV